jgi:hypothetical protein
LSKTKAITQSVFLSSILLAGGLKAFEINEQLNLEPSLRYRFQDVNDSFLGDATASTLKLRLSADWQIKDNWQGFVQLDHVHAFNEQNYNSVTVTRETSPIPDPKGSEINQFYIQYVSDKDWSAKLGRQFVSFDNERHIGKIEFWQNDQTIDALSLLYNDNVNWSIQYAYLHKVHRVFGDDATELLSPQDSRFDIDPLRPVNELGDHRHNSHLFNVKYSFNRQLQLSAFAYLLDNESSIRQAVNTFGLRATGEFKPSTIKYAYTVEAAQQKGAYDNPWNYTALYYLAELSAQYKSHQLQMSFEHLGEDNGFGFVTPLGTNHKFQGWADIFGGYINSMGLEDVYFTYRGRKGKIRWRAVAHQFSSVDDGADVGTEIDLELAYRYNREWEFKFIAAKYMADEGFANLPRSQYDLNTWSLSIAYNL